MNDTMDKLIDMDDDGPHFSENDVELAKHLAKLNVNKEKITSDIKPKSISFDINLNDGKDNLPSESNELRRSKPSGSHIKQKKHKEGNMRIKQTMRAACDIATIIENLNRKSKEKRHELSFVTPLELEKKNKRWEDFSHLARRSLYVLKREVNSLSVKITSPLTKLPDSSLRLLATSTRSCLQILKGLENFEDEIKEEQKGNFLLREAILTGQHILFIMTMSGEAVSTKNSSNLKTDNGETSEENLTKSFEILTSDMDSKVSELLNPKAVKKKLSSLVYSMKNKNGKGKSERLKYISPLKDDLDDENQRKSFYPVVEELDDGRKIEFVNDSLSPKLRRRNLGQTRKSSFPQKKNTNLKTSSLPREDQSSTDDALQYGMSEKMADAVFERILPYLNGSEEEAIPGTSNHPNKPKIEIVVLLEAQKKLDILQKRFRKLERTTQKHKQFITEIKRKFSKSSPDAPDILDLDKVIKKANICLEKCNNYENNFPYQVSSVDVIVNNLLSAHAQETAAGNIPKKSDIKSMHDEVEALKIEFWKSMIDKNVIPPPASMNVDKNDDEEEINISIHEDNSEEIFKKTEENLSSIASKENENHLEPFNPLQNMILVSEDKMEATSNKMELKNVSIDIQQSPSHSSHENEKIDERNVSLDVSEADNNARSQTESSESKTNASVELESHTNTESSGKDF